MQRKSFVSETDFMAMQFMCDYNIKYDDERKNEKITEKKCLGSSQSEREREKEKSDENERKKGKSSGNSPQKLGDLHFIFLLLPFLLLAASTLIKLEHKNYDEKIMYKFYVRYFGDDTVM